MTRDDLIELTDDPDLLFADGFDDAILGVATRCGQPPVVVYDRAKCIEILIAGDPVMRTHAEEYFSFNVEDSWVGPRTPMFLVMPE
jgi:hypothetical protein